MTIIAMRKMIMKMFSRKGTYLRNIFLFCRVWGTNVTSMGKTCDRQVNCDKKNKMTTMKGDENMKWEGTEIHQ